MKKILIGLLIVLIAGGGYFFIRRGPVAAEEPAEKPAAKVETATLKQQAIAQTIEVFGVVAAAPSADRVFAAPYDCVVRTVNVSPGSAVAAGDVLLEFDPAPDTKLAYDSARSLSALATKALAATQERFDLQLATNQELLAAQQAADDARLKADSLAARGLGGEGKIVTLAGGVVSKLELTVGALVVAGAPLVAVSTGTQLEARLGVEANDVSSVATGQTVELQSANRSEAEKSSSTVRVVGGSLDPLTGAAEVRVPVPPEAGLLLGEHVRAAIELKKSEAALVVPRSAVLPDDDKRILFTVKDGKAVKHEVKVGITADELVEITGEGLHEGDVVVTLGNYELEDGMAIQAAEKEEKKDEKKSDAYEKKKGDAKEETKPAKEAKP